MEAVPYRETTRFSTVHSFLFGSWARLTPLSAVVVHKPSVVFSQEKHGVSCFCGAGTSSVTDGRVVGHILWWESWIPIFRQRTEHEDPQVDTRMLGRVSTRLFCFQCSVRSSMTVQQSTRSFPVLCCSLLSVLCSCCCRRSLQIDKYFMLGPLLYFCYVDNQFTWYAIYLAVYEYCVLFHMGSIQHSL